MISSEQFVGSNRERTVANLGKVEDMADQNLAGKTVPVVFNHPGFDINLKE